MAAFTLLTPPPPPFSRPFSSLRIGSNNTPTRIPFRNNNNNFLRISTKDSFACCASDDVHTSPIQQHEDEDEDEDAVVDDDPNLPERWDVLGLGQAMVVLLFPFIMSLWLKISSFLLL